MPVTVLPAILPPDHVSVRSSALYAQASTTSHSHLLQLTRKCKTRFMRMQQSTLEPRHAHRQEHARGSRETQRCCGHCVALRGFRAVQDRVEATSNVQKRLDFIGAELDRLDSQLKGHQEKQSRREQQVRPPAPPAEHDPLSLCCNRVNSAEDSKSITKWVVGQPAGSPPGCTAAQARRAKLTPPLGLPASMHARAERATGCRHSLRRLALDPSKLALMRGLVRCR